MEKEFTAVVTDIHEQSRVGGKQLWQVTLDRSRFAEGDAGTLEAVARSGARLVVPVVGVEVDATGEVHHLIEKPLMAGTEVRGRVR
ncbi:alanyl-tRNA editing protein [Edaphobacter bradus]|uniref:hypothetical protein n=1 Tax=Edaphobacter bradus TaxID=2259016 RepID=UPI0021E0330E|nr:hypothetical protein [Edaphobacter bradus]